MRHCETLVFSSAITNNIAWLHSLHLKTKSEFSCEVDEEFLRVATYMKLSQSEKCVALLIDEMYSKKISFMTSTLEHLLDLQILVKQMSICIRFCSYIIILIMHWCIALHACTLHFPCSSKISREFKHQAYMLHASKLHCVVFMVRGLFNSLEFPYAQFQIHEVSDCMHAVFTATKVICSFNLYCRAGQYTSI